MPTLHTILAILTYAATCLGAFVPALAVELSSPPVPPAGPAAPPAFPSLLPHPPGFFHLAYCGNGRPADPESRLRQLDWDVIARAYEITIVQGTEHDYLRFIRSLVQRQPNHRILFYVHSHGIHSYDDRAGVLNLDESNFLHGTDPASLRVLPTAEGLLVDWRTDERPRYDEYEAISPAREFIVHGYAVYRGEGDGALKRLWPPGLGVGADAAASAADSALTVSEFLDRGVEPGRRYRYAVRTIGPLDREFDFSGEVEAVAPAAGAPLPPLVHGLESAIDAAPESKTYFARIRLRVNGKVTRALLRIDRNADGDFAGSNEEVAMDPVGEGWLEASTRLQPSDHTDLDLRVVFGFAYRLEIETPSGSIVLPERGAYTTNVNNRVRDTRWGFYVTRMSSEHWQEFVLRSLETRARKGGLVRGVFLDELVFDPALRVDAATIELTTMEEGTREAQAMVDAFRRERSDLTVYYNGLGANIPPTGATGGMIEGFAVGDWHRAPGGAPWIASPGDWEKQLEWARSAVRRGEELLLLARGPALADTRARLFALGSYLLVRAPGVRFCYMADRCRQPPLPEWGVDLGEEVRECIGMDVSHGDPPPRHRCFERGEVWVNADTDGPWRVKIMKPGFRVGIETTSADEVGHIVWGPVEGDLMIEPQSAAIIVYPPTAPGDSQP